MKPTLWAWVGLGLGTPEASTMENVYSYVSDNDQNTSPRQQKSCWTSVLLTICRESWSFELPSSSQETKDLESVCKEKKAKTPPDKCRFMCIYMFEALCKKEKYKNS